MGTRQRGWLYLFAIVGLLITLIAGTGALGAEPMGTATITAPAENARLTGNAPINGTAAVQNFQFYKLEFAMANAGWALIGDLKRAPVTNGTLGTWDTTKVPDGTYMLRLTVVDMSGNYITNQVTVMVGNSTPAPAPEMPRRGCLACHTKIAPDGRYTLAWEAHAAFSGHPLVSPSGVAMAPTDQTGISPCLECHAPGSGNRSAMGVGSTYSLRDIVHPVHMFSEIFVPEFKGNCFSCHNVGPSGEWNILEQPVTVNEAGVPTQIPIPGQRSPS